MARQSQENKMLRKVRTMRYFVDAAREIIAADGVEGITIRSVSAKAGYSSGSLYEYFENVDQLIAFVAIDNIYGFLEDLAEHVTDDVDPLELYMLLWHYFSHYAFQNPAMYEKVALFYGTDILSSLEEYNQLFPQRNEGLPALIYDSFFAVEKTNRDHSILLKCVQKGYFSQDEIKEISHMVNAGFLGYLKLCSTAVENIDTESFMRMLRAIFLFYNPNLASVIDGISFPDIS